MIHRVVKYNGVNKNEAGQYYVESLEETNIFIDTEKFATPKAIVLELHDKGVLSIKDMRKLVVTDPDSSIIEIIERKGMKPICRLQRTFF